MAKQLSLVGKSRSEVTSSMPAGGTINYRALFTGAALVEPIIFNPNAKQIKEIKGFGDKVNIEEPRYELILDVKDQERKVIDNRTVQVISLLCKYNPNELLGLNYVVPEGALKIADNYYLDFNFYISKDIVKSTKGSVLVIDSKMNSAWVSINFEELQGLYDNLRLAKMRKDDVKIEFAKTKLSNFVKAAVIAEKAAFKRSQGDVTYGPPTLDENTCRPAREGEQTLVKLLFDMSDLVRPRYKSTTELLTLKTEKEKKFNEFIESYKNFDMSDMEYVFDLFIEGNYEEVNKIIFEDLKEVFQNSEGKQCKLGVFLGVNEGKEQKLYQSYFRPYNKFGEQYTFKKPYENYSAKPITKFTSYGSTVISYEMAKSITDVENGYKDEFQKSFEFKIFELGNTKSEVKNKVENENIGSGFEGFESFKPIETNFSDDLPF